MRFGRIKSEGKLNAFLKFASSARRRYDEIFCDFDDFLFSRRLIGLSRFLHRSAPFVFGLFSEGWKCSFRCASFTHPHMVFQAIALLHSASFRCASFRSFMRAIAFSEKKLRFTAKSEPNLISRGSAVPALSSRYLFTEENRY